MLTAHVLVILSLLADGQLSAAFVNTDNLSQCEARAAAVGAILKRGGVNVQQLRCVPSALKFTRFSHAAAQTAPRHAYRLSLGAKTLRVVPVDSATACRRTLHGIADKPGVETRCVTSTQALAEPPAR